MIFLSTPRKDLRDAIKVAYPRMSIGRCTQIKSQLIKRRRMRRAETMRSRIDSVLRNAGVDIDVVEDGGAGDFRIRVKDTING